MFRSVRTRALAVLLVLATLSVSLNAGTPLIIPHQGRLLDAADTPLEGNYTITYSIFETPSGGSPLWTESHAGVVVAKGLFSVQLGSIVPLTADILTGSSGSSSPVERYLEIQLSGQAPISPRTQLGSSPYSVAASRVSGDILTSKGLAEVRDFSSLTDDAVVISSNPSGNSVTMRSLNGLPPGTPVIGALSMTTSPSSSSLDIGDLDGDGLYQVLATADSVSREITVSDNGPGGVTLMKAKEKANRTKCSSNLRAASPSIASEIEESCDLMRATQKAIQTKGTGAIASVKMEASDSTGIIAVSDLDGDGNPEALSSTFIVEEIEFAVEKVERASRIDANDDGIPESAIEETCRSGGTTLKAIQTKGTGAIAMVRMDAGDSAGVSTSYDSDGNGDSESGTSSSSSSSGTMQMQYKKGLNAVNVKRAISSMTDDFTAVQLIEADIDGDGVMENTCASSSGDASSSIAVSSRFGSGPRQTTSMDGSFSHAHIRCDSDSDGDGVQDNSVISESSVSGASLRVVSLNGLPPGQPVIDNIALTANGTSSTVALKKGVAQVGLGVAGGAIPGGSILSSRCLSANGLDTASTEQRSDGSGAAMRAINTKGTGAVVRVAATAHDSGTVATDCDDDANGFSERATWTSSSPGVARSIVAADLNGDGVYDNTVMQSCDATSSKILMAGGTSLSGTSGATMEASSTRSHVTTNKGDVEVSMDTKDESGTYTGEFKIIVSGIKSPGLKVSLNSDGIGYLSDGLGVGVPTPTHHIDVVGGAYCDGTNWVNASDRNSKENFEQVDGEDILEKISGLEITKWNYKGDDDAQHIGPTAQDFKATFGVGADDKSISTIDPSGIALAAIKELYAQMSELQKRDKEQSAQLKQKNAQLEALQGELKRLREEIKKTK